MKDKLMSRKFWVAVAAALASIGSSVAGLATQSEILAMGGIICTVVSAAIYAAAEAYVDGKATPLAVVATGFTADTEGMISNSTHDVADPAFGGVAAFKAAE